MKRLMLGLILITGFSHFAEASLGKILIVLPAAKTLSTIEGVPHSTGYFLSELATPAVMLQKMGFQLEIATPGGERPTIDKISDDFKWFKDARAYQEAQSLVQNLDGLKNPLALSSMNENKLSSYAGVFFPGGHAAMEDFPKNSDVGRILNYFHLAGKPTALICHGPAALLSAKDNQGNWIYKGYNLTAFSTAEEKIEEQMGALDGHVLFYVEESLAALGGKVQVAAPWQSHVIVDRELVTGQNPQSDYALASAFIQLLLKQSTVVQTLQKIQDSHSAAGTYTTFFLGTKKSGLSKTKFTERLAHHLKLCETEFAPYSLTDYVAYTDSNIEVAYLTWKDKASMDEAMRVTGPIVGADAGEFMEPLIFEQAL